MVKMIGVFTSVVNADFDCPVFIHNQWILQPLDNLDLRRQSAQVEFALRHFPQQVHTMSTWSAFVEIPNGLEDFVDFLLVVAEDGAHVHIAVIDDKLQSQDAEIAMTDTTWSPFRRQLSNHFMIERSYTDPSFAEMGRRR